MTAIEILKREKIQLTEQLENKSDTKQAELINTLTTEKKELSHLLFQRTLELDEMSSQRDSMKSQIDALNNNETIKKLRYILLYFFPKNSLFSFFFNFLNKFFNFFTFFYFGDIFLFSLGNMKQQSDN